MLISAYTKAQALEDGVLFGAMGKLSGRTPCG